VVIDKRATWGTINTILDKIEQFKNVPKVKIIYKAIELEEQDAFQLIPHDIVEIKRVNLQSTPYYKMYLTYEKFIDGT